MVFKVNNADLTPETMRTFSSDHIDWIYNALDVCVTFEVHEAQLAAADSVALATAAFSRSLSCPVFEMTLRGMLVDLDRRESAARELHAAIAVLEHNFNRLVIEGVGLSPPFNWRSPAQLKFLFYTVLQLKPVLKRNADGRYTPSVDRDALERLSLYFSAQFLCTHLMLLRDLTKKLQVIESELDDDGRMRTSFNIAGTNTGRLSSSASDYGTGGNQQNIDRALRSMFVPDEGMKLCNIDLEQADARNVGLICWELFVESLGPTIAGAYLDACESGDLHTTVCRMAWPELDWPSDPLLHREFAERPAYRSLSYRDLSKRLGHGTNYFGTPRTMAMHTHVEVKQIEDFQRKYFGGFPCIGSFDRSPVANNWHTWVRGQIEQAGYITTPHFSRRRYFFGRPDDDRTLREAIAYAPQSMTADTIDTGLIRLWKANLIQGLNQVHDSIVFQYRVEEEAKIIPLAIQLLATPIKLKQGRTFTIPAEAKVGFNWGDRSESNPLGLVKWKPSLNDTRIRPEYRTGNQHQTFRELFHG